MRRKRCSDEQRRNKLTLGCAEFTEVRYDLAVDHNKPDERMLNVPMPAGIPYDAKSEIAASKLFDLLGRAHRGKAPEHLLTPEDIEQLRALECIR